MSAPARSSAIPGYELCSGRPAAEEGMPDTKNALSERGDRIHAMMDSNDFKDASPDEMDTIASLVRMSGQVEEDVIGTHKRTKVVKEQEFHIFSQGLPVIVGHPDRVLIWQQDGESRALIVDFKTGFLEVDSAEENLQLLCYALGVWQELGIKRIFAKIIMPMSKGHKVVEYDEAALKDGLHYVLSILTETQKPDAKRTPSEVACRYCKALGTSRCPETSSIVEAIPVEVGAVTLTPEAIAQRLELFAIAEKIIEKEKATFKAMLEKDADAIPGWYLKPGATRRVITDSQGAFNAVEGILTMEEYQKCLTVNVGKLEDAVGKSFEQVMGPLIIKSQNAPSLSKMGKAMLREKGL